MVAIYSCETAVDFHWATRHYIPEDKTIHIDRCENHEFEAQ
jgi:hypothetical protein